MFSTSVYLKRLKDANIGYEKSGTGAFKGATGKGSFTVKFLTNPQVGFGTLTASITY